jgi:hypothetical protein
MGAYVSGRNTAKTRVMTPKMVAIQNAQRHPMLVEQKPDMIGAKRGPKTVVCELLVRTHL